MAAIENCAVVIFLSVIALVTGQLIRPETSRRNDEVCKKLAEDPFFETEMVVGKPWRIYYTWNMKIESKCLDMTFKNATQQVVQRIWNDMNEYLEAQPAWDAATLHVTMGRARHELLLFADQGPAGSFLGVPNVVRDGNISPIRNSVPLLKFQLKFLQQGRFLLMTDCHIGVSSLSARLGRPRYYSEILSATAALGIGAGFPACVTDKNPDEHVLVTDN